MPEAVHSWKRVGAGNIFAISALGAITGGLGIKTLLFSRIAGASAFVFAHLQGNAGEGGKLARTGHTLWAGLLLGAALPELLNGARLLQKAYPIRDWQLINQSVTLLACGGTALATSYEETLALGQRPNILAPIGEALFVTIEGCFRGVLKSENELNRLASALLGNSHNVLLHNWDRAKAQLAKPLSEYCESIRPTILRNQMVKTMTTLVPALRELGLPHIRAIEQSLQELRNKNTLNAEEAAVLKQEIISALDQYAQDATDATTTQLTARLAREKARLQQEIYKPDRVKQLHEEASGLMGQLQKRQITRAQFMQRRREIAQETQALTQSPAESIKAIVRHMSGEIAALVTRAEQYDKHASWIVSNLSGVIYSDNDLDDVVINARTKERNSIGDHSCEGLALLTSTVVEELKESGDRRLQVRNTWEARFHASGEILQRQWSLNSTLQKLDGIAPRNPPQNNQLATEDINTAIQTVADIAKLPQNFHELATEAKKAHKKLVAQKGRFARERGLSENIRAIELQVNARGNTQAIAKMKSRATRAFVEQEELQSAEAVLKAKIVEIKKQANDGFSVLCSELETWRKAPMREVGPNSDPAPSGAGYRMKWSLMLGLQAATIGMALWNKPMCVGLGFFVGLALTELEADHPTLNPLKTSREFGKSPSLKPLLLQLAWGSAVMQMNPWVTGIAGVPLAFGLNELVR